MAQPAKHRQPRESRMAAISRMIDQALEEEWCNGCRHPRADWGPICGGMTTGDMTHYHSPEFWLAYADENPRKRQIAEWQAEWMRVRAERNPKVRNIDDIRATGAAWVTEDEVEWLCDLAELDFNGEPRLTFEEYVEAVKDDEWA